MAVDPQAVKHSSSLIQTPTSSPDWSPDGRYIVYTADYDHQRIQLEVLDLETGAVTRRPTIQEFTPIRCFL